MPAEEDFEAVGREQLGYTIKSLPRYIWLHFPSADNDWLGTNWSTAPEVGVVCLLCHAALAALCRGRRFCMWMQIEGTI